MNNITNAIIFGDSAQDVLDELKSKGVIAEDVEDLEEAYEQADGGF